MNRKAPLAALFCLWLLAGSVVLADVNVDPATLQFGTVCVGGSSAPKTLTITNTDSEPRKYTVTKSGDHPGNFSVAPSSIEVDGNSTGAVHVVFHASGSAGARTATVSISSPSPEDSETQEVAPVGVTGAVAHRHIELSSTSIGFGEQRVGTRSVTKGLRILNKGQDTTTVTAINRGGANGAEFVVAAPALPLKVPANSFKDITVAFQPSGAGLRKGTLEITSNSCTSPKLTASMVGTGVLPDVVVQPNPIDVGIAPLGQESGPTSVTVSNDGAASLKVTAIQIVGENAADFALANLPSVPATLEPGGSFVFSIRMTPTEEGLRVATINVVSDDPDAGTFGVPVRGTATAPSPSPSPTSTASVSPTPTATSPTPGPGPIRAGSPNDLLAIALVVGGVLSAFVGLIVVRRYVRHPEEID